MSERRSFAGLLRRAEVDQVAEACRALRLTEDEAAEVLAWHRANPGLVRLTRLHGGGVRQFVLAHLECRGLIPVRTSG